MGEVTIRAMDRPGDLGWVLMAHGELYAREYGWAIEAVTARIVADHATHARPGLDAGWIAELDGRRVGSVLCVREDERTARLRLLLVDPGARGHGLGRQLVTCCIDFARDAGYARLVLWTNEPLAAARRLYLDGGFRLTGEERHREFGAEVLGQSYALELNA
ncbi:GNAT family N-acetyltransferase [Actinomycetospora chibensis]|uniref:GNAT family N-acetyltransferase n=1 Tax=Actinomycetospora chibensis TaxID=663606 RepID=A0ABV9RLC8_9PSEU|nr:GNAT family N-acetyltransferase [Actinomycetospora chibensis]MDD7925927.1 GNAT family N-acetyltransferase [Actinomycetospora chibensis]